MIRRKTCFLCGRDLVPHPELHDVQVHPELDENERDCEVEFTDEFGVMIDIGERVKSALASLNEVQAPIFTDENDVQINFYPFVDEVLQEFFDARGVPRLGGASSGRGWTSFATWQKCPYAWKRRYVDHAKPIIPVEPVARAIGSLVHAFLALHYSQLIGDSPYRALAPKMLYDVLIVRANPELVHEAWRVFCAYTLYYKFDDSIQPLAIEFDLRDPRTGESTRYDMIAFQSEPISNRPAGTYIWEHKTAGAFTQDNLSGWSNDGEILGEVMLWRRLGLDKRFGELKGVVVNILGKQQTPKFHREYVAPSSFQLEQHREDLKRWEGLIQLSRATNVFPRARNNCIGRWGRCDHWEECSLSDESINLMIPDGR